ncbi:hypothetical protein CAEBREN_03849 [Caenorhabditis brenneri]|uniref:BHLH domain-containing protein n=1 Tax=Caenorhabditis brenneri TaxID=135651 RepID=G0PBE5_CAEBE|nr:hypothetical protein CAEBREN_03849 [Caenorhabditis brenneri]
MRQNGIDDEIQKLMCFLPEREGRAQKLSRNQILMELLEIARKMTEDEAKPLKEAEYAPKENGEPSTSG